MTTDQDTPLAKFISTLKIGAVFVLVSLLGFGLARYLEEGKRFDVGSWIVIAVLAVAVLVTASIRAAVAAARKK
jgi:predicted ABC-type exoprotein transport system permease subunit